MIHRSQRERYVGIPMPLVKMEHYPPQDLTMSRPTIGRVVPGFIDPAWEASSRVYDPSTRRPWKRYKRISQLSEPEIPGVPGSGRRGKEVRDKVEQEKNRKFHMMGDANRDPANLDRLHQLAHGYSPNVQQGASQGVSIPNQINWR